MNAHTAPGAFAESWSEGLDALAFEIVVWFNLDDYQGLTDHLRRLGYSVIEIGATRLDGMIADELAARGTRH